MPIKHTLNLREGEREREREREREKTKIEQKGRKICGK